MSDLQKRIAELRARPQARTEVSLVDYIGGEEGWTYEAVIFGRSAGAHIARLRDRGFEPAPKSDRVEWPSLSGYVRVDTAPASPEQYQLWRLPVVIQMDEIFRAQKARQKSQATLEQRRAIMAQQMADLDRMAAL
jgi:hypothetical protein